MIRRCSIFVFAISLSLLFASCDRTETPEDNLPESTIGAFNLTINTLWYGEQFANTAIKLDQFGNRLRIDNFTSYISSLSLVKSDGSEYMLKDYSLFNFAQNHVLNFSVPKGDYVGIRFLLGVPADVNTDTDPAQYPNTHPLSVPGSQGMFWNWNTGYIFTKLEGKADTSGTDQPLLFSFSYHTGGDSSTMMVTLSKDITVQAGATHNEIIKLEIEKIFSPDTGTGIDLSTHSGFHTPGPLMSTFVSHFGNAFSLE